MSQLFDALHEEEFLERLPDNVKSNKGIGKLEGWMHQEHYPSVERDIAFLRHVLGVGDGSGVLAFSVASNRLYSTPGQGG